MRVRTGLALLGVGVLGAVAVTVGVDRLRDLSPFAPAEECAATVDGTTVVLDPEQAGNCLLYTSPSPRD